MFRQELPRNNRLLLLVTAFLFSTGGAAIKACSLTSWQIASFRSGIAAVALFVALPGARRNWTWRTAIVGVAYAATMVLFAVSTKLTTSANAVFLQAMAPFYVLLLGPVFLKEAVRKIDFLVIAAALGGAALLFGGGEHRMVTAPNPHTGNLMAFGSGLTWAVTLIGLRWLSRVHSNADEENEAAVGTIIAGNLIACVACVPAAVPVSHVALSDAAVLLYLGVFQIALAYVALTRSIRYVPVLEASILLLLEPVFNPLWTWFVHGEAPGWYAAAGGAIIISAAAISTWWKAKDLRSSGQVNLGPAVGPAGPADGAS